MTERGRALLINALVFPGMGQLLVLGRRRLGALLVAGSLGALLAYAVLLARELQAALRGLSVERVAADPVELARVAVAVVRHPGSGATLALLTLLACWLLALCDGLRQPARNAAARRRS